LTNWRRGPRYIVEKSLQETEFYRQLPTHEGSAETLDGLKDQYDFKIATRRKLYLQGDTESWLDEKYPGIFSDIFYDVKSKGKLAEELGAVGLIDNDVSHYHSGQKHGVESILFTPRRWNLFKRPQHRKQALTWKAIGDFLENE
jgi:5'(3')-deoxyribonucleotidase